MSFDFTTASAFKPKVENTFLGKGGGGGNTGYFRQKKKKEEENQSIMSSFLSEDKLEKMADSGMPSLEEEQGLLDKLKGFMGKIV
ncbi:MAG: hypothetical protein K6A44_07570 [bacterium]|nr:hypothetical protein [bacterium]